jgi:hypothetical protein
MRKTKGFERIGDVQVQLKRTDVKRQNYTIMLQTDDSRVEKKDRLANVPIQFLVFGRRFNCWGGL